MSVEYFRTNNFIKTKLGTIDAFIFLAKVSDILPIYYVAVRRRDVEPGAVQRVLNKRRISSITDFILRGNMFFNTFILNWTDENFEVEIDDNSLVMPIISGAAQVLDGQHRLEGLKRATEQNTEIGNEQIIIVLTQHITTKQAANIFLNINSEQKPAPQSLIYDLFGEIKGREYNIIRANDIANALHEDISSPYYQCIKLPGAAQGIGKIDLATVVNSLKSYTVDDGIFKQYNLDELETQYKVIYNFFMVLKGYYDKEGIWLKTQNPFMSNAGFFSAIKFLCEILISKCADLKSFEQETIKKLVPLDEIGLIYRDDIKNLQGKAQRDEIYKTLKNASLKEVPNLNEYKF